MLPTMAARLHLHHHGVESRPGVARRPRLGHVAGLARGLVTCPIKAACAGLIAAIALCGCAQGDMDRGGEPSASLSGLLLDPQLDEISGLAVSRRHSGVLWLLDDGDNPTRLFAVSNGGRRLATYHVEGVTKTDWEDLATFELDGKSYLLIADTGDNGGLRRTLQLHVIPEPARIENTQLKPAWSIAFQWPDGARDCEAVAVDADNGRILLVTKNREPPQLFTLPLRPPGDRLLTATQVGELTGVPRPTEQALQQGPSRARYDNQVTAAALSPDGRTLAVMTYRWLLLYPRAPHANWAEAVAQPPRISELPWLPQAEALGWSADGRSLYATGEFIPAPLYRITP